jgi:hypothetical protein
MALKRKKITKSLSTQEHKLIGKANQSLPCKECNRIVHKVGADAFAVTCDRCVSKMVAPPDVPKKPVPIELRRPRGWQFRTEYVSPEGKLYRRGEEVHEPIKPSKKPTTINSKPSSRKKASEPIASKKEKLVPRNLHGGPTKSKVSKQPTTKPSKSNVKSNSKSK